MYEENCRYSPVYASMSKYYIKDFLRTDPLNALRITNGIVLPLKGGVLDENGRYIESSAYRNSPLKSYEYDQNDLLVYDKKVVYIGYYHANHWGHLIVDGISRLWYLPKDTEDYYFCLVNKYDNNSVLSNNCLVLLNMLGIPENKLLYVTKPSRFKEVLIPEKSFFSRLYYTKEYSGIFEKIISSAKLPTGGGGVKKYNFQE
jgi:hypothetical protein